MRHMRNSLSVVAVMALLLVGGALATVRAQGQENQPAIVIDEIVHDFGSVFEAQKYKYSFTVKNEGKADLVIKSVKPG